VSIRCLIRHRGLARSGAVAVENDCALRVCGEIQLSGQEEAALPEIQKVGRGRKYKKPLQQISLENVRRDQGIVRRIPYRKPVLEYGREAYPPPPFL
jgi:hypothetical protein